MPSLKSATARRISETTIDHVRALRWAGNHESDSVSFETVDLFLAGDHPQGEKREACVIAQVRGMGVPESEEPVDDEAVEDAVSMAREHLSLPDIPARTP